MEDRQEVTNQLKDLVLDRKSFMVGNYDEVYDRDVEALEYAIKELEVTAPEVPVQEQYIILQIDGTEIGKVVTNEINKRQKRSNITLIV